MNRPTSAFHELEARYGELLSWCELLEAIADFLPCRVMNAFAARSPTGSFLCF